MVVTSIRRNKIWITNASELHMCKMTNNPIWNTCTVCPHHSLRKASLGAHRNLQEISIRDDNYDSDDIHKSINSTKQCYKLSGSILNFDNPFTKGLLWLSVVELYPIWIPKQGCQLDRLRTHLWNTLHKVNRAEKLLPETAWLSLERDYPVSGARRGTCAKKSITFR